MANLTKAERKRFDTCPVGCPIVSQKIEHLADYLSVLNTTLVSNIIYWFRGHTSAVWALTPSALRYKKEADRIKALGLIHEFKRVAELKLPKPPAQDSTFLWVQIAQHYGLPTRLLDWTESATIALYFAVKEPEDDGMVFIIAPGTLNKLSKLPQERVFDGNSDRAIIDSFMKYSGRPKLQGKKPIAVNPVWNSERLMHQKGVFTIHGPRFDLHGSYVTSLVGLPILREAKPQLRRELERIGVDEMSIFPELEHACRDIIHKAELDNGG